MSKPVNTLHGGPRDGTVLRGVSSGTIQWQGGPVYRRVTGTDDFRFVEPSGKAKP